MRNIVLQRALDVRCWNVTGTIAKASKRPELVPMLIRARERGRTHAEDLAEHLLFEPRSRLVVAQRLLQIGVHYGLLEEKNREFVLTEAGAAALSAGQVFVPEYGCWTIWASNDPLLSHPILRIDPWREPTAADEVRGKDRKNGDRAFLPLPSVVRASMGRAVAPPAGGGSRLRIDDLGKKGEEVEAEAALRLVWNVSEATMRLEGTLRDATLNTVVDAPRVAPESVWQQLLSSAGLWSSWDRTHNAQLVDFDSTANRERESLRRDLLIETPALVDFGEFDAVTIQDVPLRARTTADAREWATWRLQARVGDYATTERFSQWASEAKAPFSDYPLTLPDRVVLAREAWAHRQDRPSLAWHLVAAEDWSL